MHKLGNLTLTGYNSNLSNFDFFKKRDRTDKNNNFIGYKNKLFLNNDLRNKNEWIIEDIKKRNIKKIKN
ncbi:MAG: GmrSD restriction endonuclease domain-containing protein [Candidatus Helarchaeota archaeon]